MMSDRLTTSPFTTATMRLLWVAAWPAAWECGGICAWAATAMPQRAVASRAAGAAARTRGAGRNMAVP